ncbi:MAG: TIGR03749 family integrating conjugative element protein [Pseudoxanthomonas sp.]|nr:TIGR03749 family integrating conjugative element protein [Pseudoxanthomonas sp.]
MKPSLKQSMRLACLLAACAALPALSQQVQSVSLHAVPADLIDADNPAQAGAIEPVDLGQDMGEDAKPTGQGVTMPGAAARAARAARPAAAGNTRRPASTLAAQRAGVERAVFERQPVRVPLPVGRERLVTLPAPAALHVPTDMASVARLEVIDKTIYATALVPFTSIRIVAELIDSGQQIPMDLVADAGTATATAELEVFVVDPGRAGAAKGAADGAQQDGDANAAAPEPPAADMVELTRHAARQVYAPRRLAWSAQGVQQVDVSATPIPGLLRGVNVETAPLGQWRSGRLYVTAVRVTNRSRYPLELPLEDIRGSWMAATAQHGRIGPAGSDTDTTAIYLVCDRAFEACR